MVDGKQSIPFAHTDGGQKNWIPAGVKSRSYGTGMRRKKKISHAPAAVRNGKVGADSHPDYIEGKHRLSRFAIAKMIFFGNTLLV
jgi:hypothetical protein